MGNIAKRPDGRWRARYRDHAKKEHSRHFRRKTDAQDWLDAEAAKLQAGMWVAPRTAKMTVEEWTTEWLAAYATRKHGTVKMGKVHVAKINEEFGGRRLDSIRPTEVKRWVAKMQTVHKPSYVFALHARAKATGSTRVVADEACGRSGRGNSNARSVASGGWCLACRRSSGSTTSATTTRRC